MAPTSDARMIAFDRLAERQAASCEICSGKAIYRCPICRAVITSHSHENDFICDVHGFVSPIRESDGRQIDGDGGLHPLRVIEQAGVTFPDSGEEEDDDASD